MDLLIAIALLGIQEPLGASTSPGLGARELGLLCALPRDFRANPHIYNLPQDLDAFVAARTRRRELVWQRLPSAVSCGGELRALRSGSQFLDQLAFSPDGTLAALSGGFVLGPLNGQGGECYFTRTGGEWSLLGCRGTWVS